MIGTKLSHWDILEKIGSGGMGEVWRARDGRLGREVAVKILRPDAHADPQRLRRFLAEARTVSSLNHPNIVTLHEIGEADGRPFLVTELVEGPTVRALLADGPLPSGRAVDLAAQAAAGLAFAHRRGVIHRDVKPENLMVGPDGHVKILDFGLAKIADELAGHSPETNLTATGMIVGTPAYLSPERLQGAAVDARSDVYALGLVLFEMLTGRNPFRRDSAAGTIGAILSAELPLEDEALASAPPALIDVLSRATARDPDARYPDAGEMRAALEAARGGVPLPTGGGTRRVGVLLKGAAVVAAAALLFVLFRGLSGESGSATGPAVPPAPASPVAPATVPAGKTGVVIVPIEDRTGDAGLAEMDYARIVTDAFDQLLADAPGLHVVSRSRLESLARGTGRPFSEATADPGFAREIARAAGAGALLTGAVERRGDALALEARLVDVGSETVRETFALGPADPESLLAAIAAHVRPVPAAAAPLAGGTAARPLATRDLAAYRHYLRGNELIEEGLWRDAVPELERAIEIDPEMGLAWSALSCALSFCGEDTQARAANRKAHDHLEGLNDRERRWVALDGIWVETGNGDRYLEAMREYLRDYPDDADGYYYAGMAEEHLRGRPEAAVDWYERAYRIRPIYYPVTKTLAECYRRLGREADAIASLRRYLEHPHLGRYGRAQAEALLREWESG